MTAILCWAAKNSLRGTVRFLLEICFADKLNADYDSFQPCLQVFEEEVDEEVSKEAGGGLYGPEEPRVPGHRGLIRVQRQEGSLSQYSHNIIAHILTNLYRN